MNYDAHAAGEFWSRRVQQADELAAVLNYGVPRFANEAYSQWELACVMHALPDVAGKRVLDLACGNGRVTVPLARRAALVTAVDNAQGMLRACEENVVRNGLSAHVKFQQASATSLPFADGEFDVAICLGLLEHLPDEPRRSALNELIRIIHAGGMILVTVNNDQSVFLRRKPAYQRAEQHRDDHLHGFFSGLVGRARLEAFFQQKGLFVETVAANAFQAFALNVLREMQPVDDDLASWQALMSGATELDLRYLVKGDLDVLFADQYMIRVTKPE